MTEEEKIAGFVTADLPNLFDYLRIPSISAQNKGIPETVTWIVDKFKALQADQVEIWHENPGNPVIFAEFKGQSSQTVLFYNHYDVQPPDPLVEWESDPFEPQIRDGKVFARGVCDDKGELMSRISLIAYFKQNGGLPVNLKFFIEGEEEIGSPHVDQYVQDHAAQLKADECIWEGGGKDEQDNFQITCGLKGIIDFQLEVTTAKKDLHSSLAVFADNAAWRLLAAIESLRAKNGKILVAGFYDDIAELDEATKKAITQMDFNAERIKANYGLLGSLLPNSSAEALINATTMTINGLSSGYQGKGSKTIIPSKAVAKLDCRLVPNQSPEKIGHLIAKQLKQNGFGDVKVILGQGEAPFRTPLDNKFVKLCKKVGDQVYGEQNCRLIPNMAGSGPAQQFGGRLNLPIVMVGIDYAGSGPHSPNEHIRIKDYQQGSYYVAQVLRKLAE